MKHDVRLFVLCATWLCLCSPAFSQSANTTLAFTVSMEQPSAHYFHVVLRCACCSV
jgi:hypothetical protein